MGELADLAAEKKRLLTELEKNAGEIERLERKLSNEGFISKAPAAVVEGERAKLKKHREVKAALEAALKALEG